MIVDRTKMRRLFIRITPLERSVERPAVVIRSSRFSSWQQFPSTSLVTNVPYVAWTTLMAVPMVAASPDGEPGNGLHTASRCRRRRPRQRWSSTLGTNSLDQDHSGWVPFSVVSSWSILVPWLRIMLELESTLISSSKFLQSPYLPKKYNFVGSTDEICLSYSKSKFC